MQCVAVCCSVLQSFETKFQMRPTHETCTNQCNLYKNDRYTSQKRLEHFKKRPVHVKKRLTHIQKRPGHVITRPIHIRPRPGHVKKKPADVKTRPVHVKRDQYTSKRDQYTSKRDQYTSKRDQYTSKETSAHQKETNTHQKETNTHQKETNTRQKRPIHIKKRPTQETWTNQQDLYSKIFEIFVKKTYTNKIKKDLQRDLAAMGWLRIVGSLKWQVSFAEYRLFHRALLQKRPIILRSLRIVATPHKCRPGRRTRGKWQVSFAEYRLFHRALLQKRPIILRSLRIVATPCVDLVVVPGVKRPAKETC